jgi:mycoredoxin
MISHSSQLSVNSWRRNSWQPVPRAEEKDAERARGLCQQFCTFQGLFSSNGHLRMKLTVYTAPWCRDCHVAKRWLAQNNISYHEINIEETPGAAEEVIQRTGKRAIPQFVIDGAWVQPYIPGEGFKYREMAELFGVSE